jgi:hypothetical protein
MVNGGCGGIFHQIKMSELSHKSMQFGIAIQICLTFVVTY